MSIGVLFVCLGNICRSPTAHAVFAQRVAAQGLTQLIRVDSAGTGDWHAGEAPDARSREHAQRRGYDLSPLRARQVRPGDFQDFDYLLAMDQTNLDHLEGMRPADFRGELGLFLAYGRSGVLEVPDPYYTGARGFETVLDLVEDAADGLLDQLRRTRL